MNQYEKRGLVYECPTCGHDKYTREYDRECNEAIAICNSCQVVERQGTCYIEKEEPATAVESKVDRCEPWLL